MSTPEESKGSPCANRPESKRGGRARRPAGDPAASELTGERASAADSPFIPWLKMDRIFDPLRAEARFVALSKAMKLDR